MGDSYKFIHIFLCLAFERELDYRDMLIDRGESTLSEGGGRRKQKRGKREETVVVGWLEWDKKRLLSRFAAAI
jgi:hypothetical protein